MLTEQQIRERFNTLTSKLSEVRNIFVEQFGEDKVDMQPDYTTSDAQDSFYRWYKRALRNNEADSISEDTEKAHFRSFVNIYVYWPEVKITNESDKSHIIKDLYAQVSVNTLTGTIRQDTSPGFMLNRTTYTDAEWRTNYMHSHISTIPKYKISAFQSPCLGSGPIRGIISTLRNSYDKDWWGSFVYELDRYVRVESIVGVPFKRMASIVNAGRNNSKYTISLSEYSVNMPIVPVSVKTLIREFISYYCTNTDIPFSFNGLTYTINKSKNDFWLDISNSFIAFYNDKYKQGKIDESFNFDYLLRKNVLIPCVYEEGEFKIIRGNDAISHNGEKVLTFKGEDKTLNIIEMDIMKQENLIYLLNSDVAGKLYGILPTVLDAEYGKEEY